MKRRSSSTSLLARGAVCVAALFAAALAIAQSYPARPVRIIVPFPPAGAVDILARVVGDKVASKWKQSVVIDAEVRERMNRVALEPVGTTPAEFSRYLQADIVKWGRVVKASGARAD